MTFALLFPLTVFSILQRVTSVTISGTYAPISAAWYAGWHEAKFSLQDVSWADYTTLIYSFITTTPDASSFSLGEAEQNFLLQFVNEAKANNVSAEVAFGGWTGSRYFSTHFSTPADRSAFVKAVADFAGKYQLNGIEFDWEYPGYQGIGCNEINANDTANFLSFLRELRTNPICSNLTLSAAVSLTPFRDDTGEPSTSVSGFAEVLDYIVITDYNVWGSSSSSVGPNAPLDDTCASPANRAGSAVSAVKAWTVAGMPVHKIVLGVPSYGHSFSVLPSNAFVTGSKTELVPYPKFNASNQPFGDSWDSSGGDNMCGVHEGPSGTFNLWGLVNGGFLTTEGKPAPGIYYRYDACSQTPYVYNETSQVMVSFDNAESFAAKGKFIRETGLRGFSMFEAGGDYDNILLNSIASGVTVEPQ